MNILAKTLDLKNTHFANVHGLMNKKNYSTSNDIMKLCLYSMKRRDFR
jgi:D-alanyl-D-alanine carboxypeptidase